MAMVETLGLLVLGVDDQREHSDFGSTRTLNGVPQQGGSEFAALIGECDSETTQAGNRDCRITRQAFGKLNRHLRQKHSTGSQSIVTGNVICRDLASYE